MKNLRFKRFLRERNEFSKTGDETLLSVSEYYGVKPRSQAFADDEHESRAESLEGYRIVKTGDFVMNYMLAWKGAYGISEHDGIVSPAYAVFEVDDRIADRRYLHHRTRSDDTKALFRSRSKGIIESRLRLYPDSLLATFVDIPNLTTQKQIADFLDSETARIDALIAKKRRLIEVLGVRAKEGAARLCMSGQENEALRATGIDWWPEAPASWAICRMADLFRESKEMGEDDLPVLSVSINWGISDRELGDEDRHRIVNQIEDKASYKRVRPGDLAYNMMRAWQGAFGVAKVDGLVSPAYVVARPKAEIHTAYFEHLLRTPMCVEEFRRASKGIADFRQRLYWEHFRQVRVAIPSMAQQIAIAAMIDAEQAKFDPIVTTTEISITRLREYRAALITVAVTGQIDLAAHARHEGANGLRNDAVSTVALRGEQRRPDRPDRRTVRILVAAEVIQRHNASATLGRTKLQKLMFLAEAHANINEIAGCYERYRAGPYDADMVQEIEAGLRLERFYDAREDASADRKKVEFQRMARAGEHRDALALALGVKADALCSLVDLFKDMNTEATEAVATLYAVWNDALIDGQQPDDAFIIKGFLQEWHADKKKFNQVDLQNWLDWMQRNGVVPHGDGPRTISTSTRNLFESE